MITRQEFPLGHLGPATMTTADGWIGPTIRLISILPPKKLCLQHFVVGEIIIDPQTFVIT